MLVEVKDEGYSSKPFSTPEAAIRWVLNRYSAGEDSHRMRVNLIFLFLVH
jgi:hypothetical protein